MSKRDICLQLLREHEWVTTSDFLNAGCGSRYSARLHELRKAGYDIAPPKYVRDGEYRYTLRGSSSLMAPGEAALNTPQQTTNGAAGQQGLAASSLPGGGSIETSTADRPISGQHGNRSATEPAGLILAGGEAGNSEIRSVETASFPQASLFTLPDRSYEDAA